MAKYAMCDVTHIQFSWNKVNRYEYTTDELTVEDVRDDLPEHITHTFGDFVESSDELLIMVVTMNDGNQFEFKYDEYNDFEEIEENAHVELDSILEKADGYV